jgi:geranylgeranyl diphosphate synthase type I
MVGGKTAALLEACTGLGALVAGASETRQEAYRAFGHNLGLAFQVQDDLLGIWGDAALTGKSAESDLVSGKKSLPVLYGLSQHGEFADRWSDGRIAPDEVTSMAALLEAEGGRLYAEQVANQLTARAVAALEGAEPQGDAGLALAGLANRMLKRQA